MTIREKIKNYLETGKSLNSAKAYELFNTFSLQQHIHALKSQGIKIESEIITNNKTGNKFAEYFIDYSKKDLFS